MLRTTRPFTALDYTLTPSRSPLHTTAFLSALFLTARAGFSRDVLPFLALCRATWTADALWDAVGDTPHRGSGNTRLMYAAKNGAVPRLTWLLARGARLELKDADGRTALYWAAREGRACAVRALLARGAAVDAARDARFTPLYVASWGGHVEAVRELLARGAAVDAAEAGGCTPLIVACAQGHVEVVRELLSHNTNPAVWSNDGTTPASIAAERGHHAVLRLLRAALVLRLAAREPPQWAAAALPALRLP
jgi:ankyrin repeat protein